MPTYSVYFKPTDTLISPSFVKFCNRTTGADLLGSAPAITPVDVGGGGGTNFGEYKFTFTPTVDISFVVDGGPGLAETERYQRGVIAADDVSPWAEIMASYQTAGSVGKMLNDIYRILANKQIINDATNQLEVYNDAGNAVILAYDLEDENGNPTSVRIFRKVPS
jgi:hypothetical protein